MEIRGDGGLLQIGFLLLAKVAAEESYWSVAEAAEVLVTSTSRAERPHSQVLFAAGRRDMALRLAAMV